MFSIFADNFQLLAVAGAPISRDILVAVISIALGLNIVYAVLTENVRCYELGSVKALESSFGRQTTKIVLIFVGGLCVLMGAYLMSQAHTNRKSAKKLVQLETQFSSVCVGLERQ